MNELELVKAADKAGFKYVWVDRAPLPRRVLAPVGQRRRRSATSRTPPSASTSGRASSTRCPQVNHPAKVAERVAMLDHLSERPLRVRHRPRRGQPRDPRLPARHRRPRPSTREIWEDVIARVPEDVDAGRVRGLRGQVLVAAAAQDPAQAVRRSRTRRCGTPPATRRATRWPRRKGLGVLGFSVGDLDEMEPVVEAYKADDRQRRAGRRVRQRQHHGDDARRSWPRTREAARRSRASTRGISYLQSNVFRYHDTFPHPDCGPVVARADPRRRRRRRSRRMIGIGGRHRAATPTRRSSSARRWESAGADQLVFGIGPGHAGGHARDDPAHGRARHPEDRHRPRAPHEPLPREAAAKI